MNARRASLAILAVATSVALLTGCEPAATGASGSASASSCDPHGMPIFGGCPDGSSAPTPEAAPATQEASAPQGSCDPHGMPILQPAGCNGGDSGSPSGSGSDSHPAISASDALHEAGHVVVGKAIGLTFREVVVYPNGDGPSSDGLNDALANTYFWDEPDSPTDWVALCAAGAVARRTEDGAGGDLALMDQELSGLTTAQRKRAQDAGWAKARQIIASRSAEVASTAAQIRANGGLS